MVALPVIELGVVVDFVMKESRAAIAAGDDVGKGTGQLDVGFAGHAGKRRLRGGSGWLDNVGPFLGGA